MRNRLITACMALAAFAAFAVLPAVASATNDPDLTHPTGTLAKTGIKIEGTNIGETLMTDAQGNTLVSCQTATMTGTLTKNDGSNVEGSIESTSFKNHASTTCTSSSMGNVTVTTAGFTNSVPWCLRSTSTMATDEFQVRGNECSKASRPIRFILHGAFGVTCTYQRSTAIPGKFTTHPSDAILTITKEQFPLLEGSFLCPPAGYLDMSFTLETDTPTAEPLYIS
jgi:hypothetical protein